MCCQHRRLSSFTVFFDGAQRIQHSALIDLLIVALSPPQPAPSSLINTHSPSLLLKQSARDHGLFLNHTVSCSDTTLLTCAFSHVRRERIGFSTSRCSTLPHPSVPTRQVYTWGWNAFGQLGMGEVDDAHSIPLRNNGLHRLHVVQVAAGQFASAAVTADGEVPLTPSPTLTHRGVFSSTQRDAPPPRRAGGGRPVRQRRGHCGRRGASHRPESAHPTVPDGPEVALNWLFPYPI